MVGTSTNHVYRYDISGGNFRQTGVMTCDDVNYINNLNYLSDGTLFLSTDSGVSYVDAAGYHRVNTNDFNNSIDHMLCDYQGNLWFTSSRLGLLWSAAWSTRLSGGRGITTSAPTRGLMWWTGAAASRSRMS